MTKHNHEHCKYTWDCKHEHIGFCPVCQVPYCLDCGEEWGKKQVEYVPNPFSPCVPCPTVYPSCNVTNDSPYTASTTFKTER